jgi:alpha-beta hydrolase superfamily lysophospholipase
LQLKIIGVAKRIAHAGYAVYAMDYPGFGLSYGLHGYIPSFDGMVDHVIEQYNRIKGFLSYNLKTILFTLLSGPKVI